MSLRVKASLVERQGSMAFMSLTVLSVVNVPAVVIKVLGVPLYVGRFNILVSSQEMMPLSVQYWLSSVVHAILFWFLLSRVRMVIWCRFSLVEVLDEMCISSPCKAMLELTDLSSESMSSNLTIGVLFCREVSLSVLFTSPLLLLIRVDDELEWAGASLEVVQ